MNKKQKDLDVPSNRNRAGDLSVAECVTITAERDIQLHHRGFCSEERKPCALTFVVERGMIFDEILSNVTYEPLQFACQEGITYPAQAPDLSPQTWWKPRSSTRSRLNVNWT
jgi:hypothetical protein